jgi:putative membrane protein
MTTELPRTDQLALERTRLANERTLLSYVRTSLALIGGGVASVELIELGWVRPAGSILVVAGLILLPVGIWRYVVIRRSLRA